MTAEQDGAGDACKRKRRWGGRVRERERARVQEREESEREKEEGMRAGVIGREG